MNNNLNFQIPATSDWIQTQPLKTSFFLREIALWPGSKKPRTILTTLRDLLCMTRYCALKVYLEFATLRLNGGVPGLSWLCVTRRQIRRKVPLDTLISLGAFAFQGQVATFGTEGLEPNYLAHAPRLLGFIWTIVQEVCPFTVCLTLVKWPSSTAFRPPSPSLFTQGS